MSNMFEFFLYVGSQFFNFIASAEIFANFSILDFSVGLFMVNLVVVNFVLLAKRFNNSSPSAGRSKKE